MLAYKHESPTTASLSPVRQDCSFSSERYKVHRSLHFQDRTSGSKHHGWPGGPWHRGAVRAERRLPVLRRPGGKDQGSEPQLQPHDPHEGPLHPSQELPGETAWVKWLVCENGEATIRHDESHDLVRGWLSFVLYNITTVVSLCNLNVLFHVATVKPSRGLDLRIPMRLCDRAVLQNTLWP